MLVQYQLARNIESIMLFLGKNITNILNNLLIFKLLINNNLNNKNKNSLLYDSQFFILK